MIRREQWAERLVVNVLCPGSEVCGLAKEHGVTEDGWCRGCLVAANDILSELDQVSALDRPDGLVPGTRVRHVPTDRMGTILDGPITLHHGGNYGYYGDLAYKVQPDRSYVPITGEKPRKGHWLVADIEEVT